MSELQLQQAHARYGLLSSLCYNSTTDFWRTPTEISGRGVLARTNGSRLVEYNIERLETRDIETEFAILLHEVTHTGGGSNFGRGKSAHNPDFWEEFQRNFNSIQESEQARTLVESAFSPRKFDWERARYRAVQTISQVDKRSETVSERRKKVAHAIGYETYDVWDTVTCHIGPGDAVTPDTPVNVVIHSGTRRFDDEYSEEELLTFLRKHDLVCPLPVVSVDSGTQTDASPHVVSEPDTWSVVKGRNSESWKAMAVQERVGMEYSGVSEKVLQQGGHSDRWADIIADAPSFHKETPA